jgi:hypothetical protein
MESEVRSSPEEVPAAMSGWQSSLGVLFSPEKTFGALALRPSWLPALLLLVASTLALSVVLTPKLDMRQVMRDAIEESGQELTPAQLEQRVEMGEKFKWVGTAVGVVFQPAMYLVMAVLFMVVLRLLGSEIDFRRSLSVSVHGLMPFAVAALLALPVVMGRAEIDMQDVRGGTFLRSNLAAFAPEGTGKPMLALMGSVDLFSIWTVVLLAIGFRVVGRVSAAAAWGTVLTLWALFVAGKVALAAIF